MKNGEMYLVAGDKQVITSHHLQTKKEYNYDDIVYGHDHHRILWIKGWK